VERIFSIGVRMLLITALVGAAARPAWAQGLTAQIAGTVFDRQGLAIPGATVTARNTGTQTVREAVTNDAGAFVVTNVIAGRYEVKVAIAGFKTYTESDVVVTTSERVALAPITLEIGALTESIVVSSTAVQVQTMSGERSATITANDIADVGLRGRDFMGTLKVLPGIIDTSARNAPGWGSVGNMTINGQTNFNFSYDGVTNKDTGSNSAYGAVARSIAEVKVHRLRPERPDVRATIVVVTKAAARTRIGGILQTHEAFNANRGSTAGLRARGWQHRTPRDAAISR
jgi:hypothetical protein